MKKIRLDSPHARARLAMLVGALALALLAIVFFRTQVLRAGPDVLVEQGNRLRAVPLPAPRGDIVDRNGVVLAGTAAGTALVLMPAPADSVRSRLRRVAQLLDLPDDWRARAERAALEAARPYVVTTELRPSDVGMLAAHQNELSGVLVEPWPRRVYPAGSASAAVVGAVGFEPWPAGTGENVAGAEAGHVVGRSGLELAFDSLLAGESGIRYVEMDAAGSVIVDPSRVTYREPRPGQRLRTRLDATLQRRVADLMPSRSRSAAVVLEVATGDVLALYSAPAQARDTAGSPENAALALVAEPGAVFHPITAAIALESGRVDPERPQTVPCRGGMRYGERYFRCWKSDGHGQLALAAAIRDGCDVYFHQVALRLGLQALLEMGARLGLDRTTGLELPEERPGRFPTTVTALGERLGRAPNPSDALDLGSGYGLNRATLVRMTHAYAALAAGGAAPAARVTGSEPAEPPWRIELPAAAARLVMAALDSVTAPGGPAAAAATAMMPGTRIRGQSSRAREGVSGPRPAGWFVGVAGAAGAPARIAVGVLVERAPSDDAAAALAGRIADYYLRSQVADPGPQARDTATPSSTTVTSP